nr:peptidoglycan bridge formation glycyltransferase FemA/FemB family protein [Arthrobacter roseus]
MQTDIWATFQRELGKTVHTDSGTGWSFVSIVETSPLGLSLYCPYGPVAQDSRSLTEALTALQDLARTNNAFYLRVEPVNTGDGTDVDAVLRGLGLRPAPLDVQPRHSWLIDLRDEPTKILAGMRSSNRNVYRNVGKKGVSIRSSHDPHDIEILIGFLTKTAEEREFTSHSADYLRTAASVLMPAGAAELYIAELTDHGPIAAALTYDTPDERVYAHAAADDNFRKLSASVAVVVQLLMDAHNKGVPTADMWGIAPPDQPDHKWAGFTRFKQSFGGTGVIYTGTWDLPVVGLRYRLYRGLRSARSVISNQSPRVRRALTRLAHTLRR